jgi:phosphodiesterase/alkaline phosphatase D-like protein
MAFVFSFCPSSSVSHAVVNRYSQYKRDPSHIAMASQFPIISIWDDHEFADDASKDGAANHKAATQVGAKSVLAVRYC